MLSELIVIDILHHVVEVDPGRWASKHAVQHTLLVNHVLNKSLLILLSLGQVLKQSVLLLLCLMNYVEFFRATVAVLGRKALDVAASFM